MKMNGNTILITGGTSGIGLELAAQLTALGNVVIVTGRDWATLENLAKEHPLIHTIQSDVSDPAAIASLYRLVIKEFPALNMLINNAGIMRKINLQDSGADLVDITLEMETNLMGPIRMVKQFLPHLKLQPWAAIVNVTSALAFTPFPISPIYCATKAGLHSYTQSLRVQLKNTSIKVFELAPPSINTRMQEAFSPADIKGVPTMSTNKLVQKAIKGFQADRTEILPGLSKVMRMISRLAPGLGVKSASGSVDAMLAETK
jgi:uncharacterized oxidoreductase